MDYCIRGGHNYGVPGASSKWLDEVDFDRKYSKELMSALRNLGYSVIDGTPNRTNTRVQDLAYGVNIGNNNRVKAFISCHVNSADSSSAKGCEVLYYRTSNSGKVLAEKICSKLAELGFKNRGAKADDRGLYELRHTNMPAVIIEPFFLSSKEDVDLALKVGPKAIAQKIAEGITGKSIASNNTKQVNTSSSNGWINLDGKTGVCTGNGVRVRSSKSTANTNNVIGKLNKGDKVQLFRKEGDWIHIYYPAHGGYVAAQYIRY